MMMMDLLNRLRCKTFKTRYFMLACGGGHPLYRVIPRVRKEPYHPYWGLWGFSIYWLGVEFLFCFCEDRKGLYAEKAK